MLNIACTTVCFLFSQPACRGRTIRFRHRQFIRKSRLSDGLSIVAMSEKITSDTEQIPPNTFEEVEHTADRAVRIYGGNLQELLQNAAKGMNSLMVSERIPSSRQVKKTIALETLDAESLLVQWLSELVYWAETEMLVFHEFDIDSVSPTHVRATIYGGRANHLDKHIKAVTYHNLQILQTETGLVATVVFDV